METKNGTNDNEKIEAMRRRFAAYKAKLDQAVVRDQKAKAKVLKHEFADVGATLCRFAAKSPEFHGALKQMLAAAITVADEPTRKFLTTRGWL
jgi:hypothetical protein